MRLVNSIVKFKSGIKIGLHLKGKANALAPSIVAFGAHFELHVK